MWSVIEHMILEFKKKIREKYKFGGQQYIDETSKQWDWMRLMKEGEESIHRGDKKKIQEMINLNISGRKAKP